MIVAIPGAGLGNRMRFVESSIALAEESGEDLTVLWVMNRSLNSRFDDLFETPVGVSAVYNIRATRLPGRLLHRGLRVAHRLVCARTLTDGDLGDLTPISDDLAGLVSGRRVEVAGCKAFHGTNAYFGRFVPTSALQRIVDEHLPSTPALVGVHIRRGDGEWPSRFSPTWAFVDMMEAAVRSDSATEFFVASDSVEEVGDLQRRFPGRIHSYPKRSYERTQSLAIQDAVVDLFCLSRCREIIGSFGSSFSDVAGHVGGVPVERPRVFPTMLDQFAGRLSESELRTDATLFRAVRRVRWSGGMFCHLCGGDQLQALNTPDNGPHEYWCRNCRDTFDDLSGTVLSEHPHRLREALTCALAATPGRRPEDVAQDLSRPVSEIEEVLALLRTVP